MVTAMTQPVPLWKCLGCFNDFPRLNQWGLCQHCERQVRAQMAREAREAAR
jgi:hypothetical protein